jgi:hypothetical protein
LPAEDESAPIRFPSALSRLIAPQVEKPTDILPSLATK